LLESKEVFDYRHPIVYGEGIIDSIPCIELNLSQHNLTKVDEPHLNPPEPLSPGWSATLLATVNYGHPSSGEHYAAAHQVSEQASF